MMFVRFCGRSSLPLWEIRLLMFWGNSILPCVVMEKNIATATRAKIMVYFLKNELTAFAFIVTHPFPISGSPP